MNQLSVYSKYMNQLQWLESIILGPCHAADSSSLVTVEVTLKGGATSVITRATGRFAVLAGAVSFAPPQASRCAPCSEQNLAVAEGPLVDHVRTILRMPPILLTGWTSSPAASAISLSPCARS